MTKVTKSPPAPKTPVSVAKSSSKKTAAAPAKKPTTSRKSPVKKVATGSDSAKNRKLPISKEQRWRYIEVAAYFMAERRGFVGANPTVDWVQAEIEIDRMLSEGKLEL